MLDLLKSVYSGLAATRAPTCPEGDYATWIGLSFLLHSILFILLPASPWLPKPGVVPTSHKGSKPYDRFGEGVKIRNGHVSSFHAAAVVTAVVWWFTQYTFTPFDFQRNMQGGYAVPGNTTGDAYFPMFTCFTVGYFLYDTICMAYYHKYLGNTASYVHHLAIGIALFFGIISGVGRTYHALYLFEELSTVPLNMKNLYKDSPNAYKFWSILFAVSFVLSRGLFGLTGAIETYWSLGTYWWAHRVAQNSFYFDFLIFFQFFSFTTSRCLNIYWMSLIAKYLRRGGKKKDVAKDLKATEKME